MAINCRAHIADKKRWNRIYLGTITIASAMSQYKQHGFTLIELMIVVGIIGIMVSLAGPMYTRYQAKARQSEAKIALAAVYGLEKAFYSEYSAYVPSMEAIGYLPEGARRFYTVGWYMAGCSGSWAQSVSGYSASLGTPCYPRVGVPQQGTGPFDINCRGAAAVLPDPTASPWNTNDPQSMIAGAAGAIRTGGQCDIWTITESKILANTQSGL